MKPYGAKRQDRWKSKCSCCNYDKFRGADRARKGQARQQSKKECLQA